jgi:hypothetical protein
MEKSVSVLDVDMSRSTRLTTCDIGAVESPKMHVGQLVKFELSLGRYVFATVRCIFTQKGIEKLRVQYGSNSFVVIRADQVIGNTTEVEPSG